MTDAPTRPGAVVFADVQRVLGVFAQGIAGRHLHLEEIPSSTDDASPGRITTDGTSIRLPASVADFATARHNRGAYRTAVLHQIGFIELGTFDFSLATARRLGLTEAIAPTGWIGPSRQVSDLERFFAASSRPRLVRHLFSVVEDLRIDTALRQRYPGARADLDRVLVHALAGRTTMGSGSASASLLETLVRFSLGADPDVLIAFDPTGLAADAITAAGQAMADDANVYTSARVALIICALIDSLPDRSGEQRPVPATADLAESLPGEGVPDKPGGALMDDERDGIAEPSDDEVDAPGVEFRGELLPDLVHRNRAAGQYGSLTKEPPTAVESLTAEAGDGLNAPSPRRAGLRHAGARRADFDGQRSFLYDEWDYRNDRYLGAWCRVHERRGRVHEWRGRVHERRGPTNTGPTISGAAGTGAAVAGTAGIATVDGAAFIGDVRRRHAILANQVKRRFRFIRPESWLRVHRTSDGDELGIDAVIEAVIDRRTGHATDEHLYIRRDRGLRDVAAAFLLDLSASTSSPVIDLNAPKPPPIPPEDDDPWGDHDPTPPPTGRRVIDIAKDALALMCDALHTLGDAHAIYGFSGKGREHVEFHIAKEFADAPSIRTWAALADMQPRSYTRMGPAIRHTTTKLAAQPMRTKLMLIVSDGYPQDEDYGPDRGDNEYGLQDTAQALREAEQAGILTFCITIDPAGHDYLRRMCPDDHYLVINDVQSLPGALEKVYRALTGSRPATGQTDP